MRFLIVSGPTREPLDPVRYLSNYSTGTMGKCLASAAKSAGHRVDWVQCPQDAETARDLLSLLRKKLPKNDVFIMAAAVCDSRPATFSSKKIKKEKLSQIRLVKNPDVLASLRPLKTKKQLFIGFALESVDILRHGLAKLKKKGLDLIVVQEVNNKNNPFGDKKIDAYLVDHCCATPFKKISKDRLAKVLVSGASHLLGRFA